MISFFKYQDPLRLGLILALLVIIRLPVFLAEYPLFLPELEWLTIGASLGGGKIMYRDIIDTLEPLSAGTYMIVVKTFGSSTLVFQILSLVLVYLQAVLFNLIININNLFPDKNYVPALIYVVLSSLFVEFYTLSPILLGTTFLLFTIHLVLLIIRMGDHDEEIFYTGVSTALAALFYYPYFVFLFLAMLSFLLYSPGSLRKYFVLFTGFILPFAFAGTYYFLRDGLDEFMGLMSYSLFGATRIFTSIKFAGSIMIIPALLILCGFVAVSAFSRYINFQYVAVRILGFWLIFGVLSLYFAPEFSGLHLFVFVPAAAFFGAHFFLLVKNKWIREGSFLVLGIAILWTNYYKIHELHSGAIPPSYQKIVVGQPSVKDFSAKGNSVVVLGNDPAFYKGNKLATPYFDWQYSSRYFSDLSNYDNVSRIYENFLKDKPDVIIDLEGWMPKLEARIPYFKQEYEQYGEDGKVFVRRGI